KLPLVGVGQWVTFSSPWLSHTFRFMDSGVSTRARPLRTYARPGCCEDAAGGQALLGFQRLDQHPLRARPGEGGISEMLLCAPLPPVVVAEISPKQRRGAEPVLVSKFLSQDSSDHMRVLLLHPNDSPRRGPWASQCWDLVVDLAKSAQFSADVWQEQMHCSVLRSESFREGAEDVEAVRKAI